MSEIDATDLEAWSSILVLQLNQYVIVLQGMKLYADKKSRVIIQVIEIFAFLYIIIRSIQYVNGLKDIEFWNIAHIHLLPVDNNYLVTNVDIWDKMIIAFTC